MRSSWRYSKREVKEHAREHGVWIYSSSNFMLWLIGVIWLSGPGEKQLRVPGSCQPRYWFGVIRVKKPTTFWQSLIGTHKQSRAWWCSGGMLPKGDYPGSNSGKAIQTSPRMVLCKSWFTVFKATSRSVQECIGQHPGPLNTIYQHHTHYSRFQEVTVGQH